MLTALLLLATSASAVQNVFPWYPNTFPGAVYFDSTTYVPEIQWADGSTSTTAVQGGVQNIYISTVPGPTGTAATITAGTAASVSSTTAPTVTNSGTTSAAVFNFGIPAGHDGAVGPQGSQGVQGPAGMNGLLTFSNAVSTYLIVAATDWSGFYALTVDLDGVVRISPTSLLASDVKILSNSSFTSRIAVDPSDGVWRMQANSVTLRLSDYAILDTNRNVWDLSIDLDGTGRTTWVGSL